MGEEKPEEDKAAVTEEKTTDVDTEDSSTKSVEEPKTNKEEEIGLTKSTVSEDSGDNDSAVLVDHEDADDSPQALQIVSIGSKEDNYAFKYHTEKLESIITRVPEDAKVAVVSVVGAFRTGKSFLLCWFLRYLHHLKQQESKGEVPSKSWIEEFDSLGDDGFHWRAGSERNTTGIWMWSEPHYFKQQNLAVLLVDTQGMFDHETTMSLTASIFGLSTLLSSYQIYNISKMIQEDNLQQLALFSEYARAAMSTKKEDDEKPFQQVEFLIRDWQHFHAEEFEEMIDEMDSVLEKIMAPRDAQDLKETREQISMCFEDITCYGLPYPGSAVTKKAYNGEVDKMDEDFRGLLSRYCPRVFNNLAPKIIHGRSLTGRELASYIESYAKLFASGAKFPEASTMLEATASANNTNAINEAIKNYKECMDKIAGPQCSNYLRTDELQEDHRLNITRSLEVFEAIANFGSQKSIQKSKRNLMERIDSDFAVYQKLNDSRNPLLGMELYLVPLSIAMISYIIRMIMDLTCTPWSQVCKSSSDFLSHTYAVVVCFLMILGCTKAKQIQDFGKKCKTLFETMNNTGASPGPTKAKKE